VDVALVTGDHDLAFAATIDAPLEAALAERGVAVHHPAWRDDLDWSRFDVTVVRTPWEYPAHRDAFVDWASATGAVTRLWNPAEVLRWNTHKSYLLELEDRGAPVVPTAWLGRGDQVDLAALLASRSWSRAVVKPAVANGSDGLRVVAGDDDPVADQAHLDRLVAAGDVMVQPYLDRVERDGETSVVLVDGTVTHVVRKQPVPGEHRIQETFGGRYTRVPLDGAGAEPAALARWVVDASGHEFLYARVDLLRAEDGTWQLAELEVTEPDLYLTVAPDAAAPLADAIIARAV
jgi:glutathione synthase/RimK-type ligase-like ATP-grasp enzyme